MNVHHLKHATLEKRTVGYHKKFCKAPLFFLLGKICHLSSSYTVEIAVFTSMDTAKVWSVAAFIYLYPDIQSRSLSAAPLHRVRGLVRPV